MNAKLAEYIKNCEEVFDFEIHASTTNTGSIMSAENEYEEITRPHLANCTNPDGSGPNKSRAAISKLTDGFIYIVAKSKETGEVCGAESFQIYELNKQAIPESIYSEAMKQYNQKTGKHYSNLKNFIADNKLNITVLETHRLMSWVRGYHLAAVMIYKLEKYARQNILTDPNRIYLFFETVNQYSKKAFELNDFNFVGERQMGSKTKYIGCKL